MTSKSCTTSPVVRVAIDVAKLTHQVLLELPSGKRRVMRVANTKAEIDRFVATLRALELSCEIAFEPTGDYHRPLAYLLGQAGFHLCLVSSIAVARTREALYNSWDKNDPKDAQVILHLLKNGTTQRYLDPLMTGYQDLQEMANTYQQISLRKCGYSTVWSRTTCRCIFPRPSAICTAPGPNGLPSCCSLRRAPPPYGVTPRPRLSPRPASRSVDGRSTRPDGSPTSMRPLAAAWGCPCPRRRRPCACLGGARGVSGALSAAQAPRGGRRDPFGESARLCPVADTARDRADPGDDHPRRGA